MPVQSTRLQYAASSDPSELAAAIQGLPFKVEIKAIVRAGADWFCWFVLPDNIPNSTLRKILGDDMEVPEIKDDKF